LEKRAEKVLPGNEESRGWGGEKEGAGSEGRNDPNTVCTYEYMNKKEKTWSKLTMMNIHD
jgi:hypothetical protein